MIVTVASQVAVRDLEDSEAFGLRTADSERGNDL